LEVIVRCLAGFVPGWNEPNTEMNALPPLLAAKLADFRRRVWVVKGIEGVLAGLFGLLVSFVVVFGLDRLIDTPGWLRGLIFAGGAAVVVVGLPVKWYCWVWRQRRLEDAARLLRQTFPRLGDQLLGIVELARMEAGEGGRSERLVQAAMAQTDDEVRDRDFSQAVPRARHKHWAVACGAVAVVVFGVFVLVGEAARNALARWAMPWTTVERYTFARIETLPAPWVVPYAEPLALEVNLSPGSLWKPTEAKVLVPAQPGVGALRDAEGRYVLALPPQKEDTVMRLRVGDVRRDLVVQPRPRPELSRLTARLRLPDYLQYQSRPEIEVRGGAVSLLRGAEVTFLIESVRPLATATLDGEVQAVREGKMMTEVAKVPDEVKVREFWWTDELGLSPREPLRLSVQPVKDEAPRIVARRESLEQVVLDTEVVVFDLSASDDFGIRRLGLSWRPLDSGESRGSSLSAAGEKVAAAGAPESREMAARATFCAVREGIAPQSLEIRAWAEDYLEGRERAQSAVFALHILNATDHALWLTQQMGKWLDVARETYEREQQLHEMNQELRQLSAAELDQPQNRRRIAQQANAEQANAARLGGLNEAGKRLVEQATRNPEFDAKRLESWATMLKSLQNIAAKRMPSVAELLKQSSNAAAGAKPELAVGEGSTKADGRSSKPGDSEAGPAKGGSEASAPKIAQGPELPGGRGGGASEVKPDREGKAAAPSIKLSDGSEPVKDANAKADDPKAKAPGVGKLGLPSNTLAAAPRKPGETSEAPPAETQAQDKLDRSVWEQRDLLKEFAQVTDQLSEILASLEASTFVKRLKAASREQLQLASGLQRKTLDAFGLAPGPEIGKPEKVDNKSVPNAAKIVEAKDGRVVSSLPTADELAAALEKTSIADARAILSGKSEQQSEVVRVLQSDLDAYVQRRPDQHLKKVLGQMKDTQVVRALGRVGDKTQAWMSGQAIAGAEYWADVLDRWAEEMVAAGKCSSCTSGDQESLPPEIVLKVMQSLRDEMKLRDETRELENAKAALKVDEHTKRAYRLSGEQSRIAVQTQSAFDDILRLPGGGLKFGKELQLLGAVRHVMDEVVGILDKPDSGAPAIAAETEAIELLLQTKRQNPNGGGGGGSDPGGGGGAAAASRTALAELGEGAEVEAQSEARSVGQATGHAGKEFPEEFKAGLDAYFNQLESGPGLE
jgi:hypothetical protein